MGASLIEDVTALKVFMESSKGLELKEFEAASEQMKQLKTLKSHLETANRAIDFLAQSSGSDANVNVGGLDLGTVDNFKEVLANEAF